MTNIFQKSFWVNTKTQSDKGSDSGMTRSSTWTTQTEEKIASILGISLDDLEVNEQTALTIPAVLACLEVRNNSHASVSLHVHQETEQGPEVDKLHPLDRVLNRRANRYQTSFTFRKTLGIHRDVWGVGIAVIDRDRYRQVTGLRLLQPAEYTIYETHSHILSGREYTVVESDGTIHVEEDLVIWKGISTDGYFFKGIVGCVTKVIRTGLTTRDFINKYYKNGTFLGGVLTSEAVLDKDQRDMNRKNWEAAHGGTDKAGKVAVLSGGLKFQPIANTLVDSQLVEFLSLDKSEIYQAFGVLPHLVGDTTKATSFGSGIEHLSIQFVTYTLLPGAIQLEQEINYKCFRDSEQDAGQYVEHNFDTLLRADYKTRMEGYGLAIEKGIYNPNDIRKKENEKSYEGGNTYMVNGNMIPVSDVGKQYDKQNGTGTQVSGAV